MSEEELMAPQCGSGPTPEKKMSLRASAKGPVTPAAQKSRTTPASKRKKSTPSTTPTASESVFKILHGRTPKEPREASASAVSANATPVNGSAKIVAKKSDKLKSDTPIRRTRGAKAEEPAESTEETSQEAMCVSESIADTPTAKRKRPSPKQQEPIQSQAAAAPQQSETTPPPQIVNATESSTMPPLEETTDPKDNEPIADKSPALAGADPSISLADLESEWKKEIPPHYLSKEPLIRDSVSAAIAFLYQRGFLRAPVQQPAINSGEKEQEEVSVLEGMQHYQPSFTLRYTDEAGRELTPKEAYKKLCHRFHGITPGKQKMEKMLRKIAQEKAIRQMPSTDTPLGTASLLAQRLHGSGSAYVVLGK